ncbi:MAG: SCO family protein [Acidobacteriota bacterium]|nr:SCO family protein [Acidobacteriota bacterium]
MHSTKSTKRNGAIVAAILLSAGLVIAGGCSKSASRQSTTQQSEQNVKRYKLVGKIVSMDKEQKTLNIDGQDIPGFMSAMVMPYPVLKADQLDGLEPGDEITADVVVNQSDSSAHLENIVVTKKAGAGKPTSEFHIPKPGDPVPDFVLVDQNNKRIHLDSFRGSVLLVTFIYTRCPFANFCPLVSHDFAEIYARTKKDPALEKGVRLLTVSFDSQRDTPPVLRRYGESFRGVTGDIPFGRWEFATAPAKEMQQIADFFGLSYSDEKGKIVHSMSTTVVAPDGKVYKWYDGSDWQPSELVAAAAQALRTQTPSHASGM